MLKKTGVFALIGLAILILPACSDSGSPKKVSLENREELQKSADMGQAPLRIAVGGMVTPREGFVYYREFIDYIGVKLKRPVRYIDREKYDEINRLMKNGEIDAAFVCSGPYVDGHDEFGMELLAAPQAYHRTVYYAYIIVAKDSPVSSLAGLRGKTFAFADPLSNTGKLVPEYLLAAMNETPDTFFKKYIFTYAHDKSIKAVAEGVVDGASVDSLIWEYTSRMNPALAAKTKIIAKSPPYAVPPVVVRQDLPSDVKRELRRIFLSAHRDVQGRKLLSGMMIDRFVVLDDSAYDSVRAMKVEIAGRRGANEGGNERAH